MRTVSMNNLRRLVWSIRNGFWGLVFFAANVSTTRYWAPSIGELHEKLRMLALSRLGARIGRDSYIRSQAFVTSPARLSIGSNTIVGSRCKLYLTESLTIGDDVEIGPGLTVITSEHEFSDPSRPLGKQGGISSPVSVGDGVYIGANVTILKGVSIEDRLVVGAGSLVNKSLASGWVYAGVPAVPLRRLEEGKDA